jgi:hypothetical protein
LSKQRQINILIILAVLVTVAVVSTVGRQQESPKEMNRITEADSPLSCWGLKIGSTSQTVASVLKVESQPAKGAFNCCAWCEPKDWTGEYCLEHSSTSSDEEQSPKLLISYHEGRVNGLSSDLLERNGEEVLRQGDSLDKVLSVFPGAHVKKHDDWSTVVYIPDGLGILNLHGNKVSDIQLTDRRWYPKE